MLDELKEDNNNIQKELVRHRKFMAAIVGFVFQETNGMTDVQEAYAKIKRYIHNNISVS
jgi:hypothetical protein